MKIWKLALAVMVSGITIAAAACSTTSNAAQTTQQIVTIQRGDITVGVTASGNLEFSRKEDLAFETAGTVKDVLVAAGDTVKEGQELASLDTADWQDQITTLQRAVTTAQRSQLQAEINVRSANITLEKDLGTYKWPDIQIAQAELDNTKAYYEYVLESLQDSSLARTRLTNAQTKLDALLTLGDTEQIAQDRDQLKLVLGKLEDARTAVADAQKALADAKATSPTVKAPFAGFISSVSVTGGQEVKKGAIAAQIVDPTKFQATILVSEQDILSVTNGMGATVQIDAMPSVILPAKVTSISPTATIASGVVNYQVKVELQSTTPLPPRQSSSGQTPSTSGQSGGQRSPSASGRLPSVQTAAPQLREGLSVTVNIPIVQKSNIVLVPTRAIIRQGQQITVQVIKNSVIESRIITTGISNNQYTEVTEGLSEGEKVVIQASTTGTTTSPNRSPVIIPGMGGFGR